MTLRIVEVALACRVVALRAGEGGHRLTLLFLLFSCTLPTSFDPKRDSDRALGALDYIDPYPAFGQCVSLLVSLLACWNHLTVPPSHLPCGSA